MPSPDVNAPCVGFLQSRLDHGGAERLIQELVRGLRGPDLRPVVLTLREPGPLGDELAAEGVLVLSGIGRGRLDPWTGRRLAEACRSAGVGALYATDSPLPLFWAGQLRRNQGPRLAIGFHSTALRTGAFQHALARARAIPVADTLIALSPGHREHLARELGVAESRFEIIPNGVDTTRFAPPVDRAALRHRLGLPERAPIVTLVAALRPEKNHPMFVRAAAALSRALPDVQFLVVGSGPERERIEQMAAGVSAVRLLGVRDDVPDLVAASDVVALCSHPVVETFPLSLLEALSSGTPVVSTRVGSIADIVVDGTTGFLVPVDDQAGFERCLTRLLTDPDLRGRMSVAARTDALARFQRSAMIAAYRRVLGGLACAARPSAEVSV